MNNIQLSSAKSYRQWGVWSGSTCRVRQRSGGKCNRSHQSVIAALGHPLETRTAGFAQRFTRVWPEPDLILTSNRHHQDFDPDAHGLQLPSPPTSFLSHRSLRPVTIMFPSSVRRVVSSAPQTALASSLTSSAPRAATATVPVFVRGHQRRYSSSKPSRSDNGSSDISTGQSVTTSSSTSRTDGKTSTEKRKRKSKDASDKGASFKRLPSVPSTHHMSQEGKKD